MEQDELYRYIEQPDERQVIRFGNNAKELSQNGRRQFLVPGCIGGGFCLMCGIALTAFDAWHLAASVFFSLGAFLLATSTLLFALFQREAKRASGCFLSVTPFEAVYVSDGAYCRFALSDIRDIRVERDSRFGKLPFDMTSLERNRLVIVTEEGDTPLCYLASPEHIREKLLTLPQNK